MERDLNDSRAVMQRDAGEKDTFSLELLIALERWAGSKLSELNRAVKTHQHTRTQHTRRAAMSVIGTSQHVVEELAKVIAMVHQQKKQMTEGALPTSFVTLVAQLESHRAAICRALPAAAAAVEASGEESAAEKVNALRSLMHTRSILNAELHKVQGAVKELAGSSESLEVLHGALQNVNATVEIAQKMVGKLLSIKTVDDIVLRVSLFCFVLVVAYIITQRVFGFFPSVVRR
ncbi:Sec20, putative [Trypanosoma equiperdum]|uniref:Sec20 C-terminal domain-containing protein n=2 Tax=Trypanozoon TaxID=39700 RepID=Q384X7_TRYB2|nr:hypothetical protein, conserved [Trypanosoma brucei brucei TREU927]EAN79654.1 hypothetical protein, conserved [Trypanosoma brucei brucei TREU927]SCU70793.1 Sec20, putative [Trypanosoma equiperdum]